MSSSMAFGDELKRLRKQQNLSIWKLAVLADVSQSYLANVETNKRSAPSPAILRKIAEPLGITFIELMLLAGHLEEIDFQVDRFSF